ncbi:MAG TPA: methylmalonyl Co-A mutase-associated GTPase MeaB [Acidobacteriaceae bacterium]|jgi:LAO/AO transport system kinase|nr:methylmalonyl Co-A mutase-associated GTPase MeaB [Acidobacteriaceae bacterium]
MNNDSSVGATEVTDLVARLRQGDVRALARAVSLVENDAPSARQILSGCFPYTGSAMRIGITGSPGAGKSTLVDGLARRYRAQQTTVGVVGVDPTSPFTGGAILGDRIRMREHDTDPGFYMRSMATRGSLGGLARSSADVAAVIEASGKQRLLLETVGVGQDEIDIARLADVTVVVLVPGMGDDVQSLKAGIMEIADIFVVNKSDRDGADRVEKEVRSLQSLTAEHGSWIPPAIRTIATTGAGIEELDQALDQFWSWLAQEGRLSARRETHWRMRVMEMVRHELLREMRGHGLTDQELAKIGRQVVLRQQDPYQLALRLVEQLMRR